MLLIVLQAQKEPAVVLVSTAGPLLVVARRLCAGVYHANRVLSKASCACIHVHVYVLCREEIGSSVSVCVYVCVPVASPTAVVHAHIDTQILSSLSPIS